ncbi:MAG: hypothetical protein GY771_12700 [bacterium]|nr:hypothetical protein [bacterium]
MSRFIIISLIISTSALAAQSQFNYELNLLGGYEGEGAVYTVPGQRPGIGFEYFQVFSGEYGDIAKTDVQVRLTADPDGSFESPYIVTPFYGNDDTPLPAVWLELHNAYIHFKLNRGRSDVWLGHRDVPFGLEPKLDTHGSLLQSFALESIGFKKDWGGGVIGRFEYWDYSVAVGLGSGMLITYSGNWLAAGRVGILDPDRSDVAFGFSGFYGEPLPTMGLMVMPRDAIERTLGGFDVTIREGRFSALSEVLYGKNGEKRVSGVWLRLGAEFPDWHWLTVNTQGSIFNGNIGTGDRVYRGGLELNAKYNAAITLGGAYLYNDDNGATEHRAMAHFYYFYPKLTQWAP